jgi:pectin methylesterase-like acyl-CoA thioesterase
LKAGDKAVIAVEEGIYREIVSYKGGKAITIEGPSVDNEFGKKVEIIGINCNAYNGSSHTRASFYWSGSDLTLKNVTIQNAYDRNIDSGGQSEALYFANGAGKKLVAFNSSFKGFQDTIQTSGKNWFYKCYIEGDTDFIWGTADVALFEECEIVMLNTSGDTVKASDSIIFETRVGNIANNLVSKGYVLFNSKVSAEHPTSYLARRASNKDADGNDYYDQAAIIDTEFTGTLSADLWLSQNVKADKLLPEYIEKDANGNMNVGWKVYGLSGSGYSDAKVHAVPYGGTITEAVYNNEYNGRDKILNRVFNKTTGAYEAAAENWDTGVYSLN